MCVFNCNLNCTYCDTKLDRFTEYEPEELLKKLNFIVISTTRFLLPEENRFYSDFLKEILSFTLGMVMGIIWKQMVLTFSELEQLIGWFDIIAMDLKFPSSTDG